MVIFYYLTPNWYLVFLAKIERFILKKASKNTCWGDFCCQVNMQLITALVPFLNSLLTYYSHLTKTKNVFF